VGDFDDDAPTRVDSGPLVAYEFLESAETPTRQVCTECGGEVTIWEADNLPTPLPGLTRCMTTRGGREVYCATLAKAAVWFKRQG
jgi:hypothetical protein